MSKIAGFVRVCIGRLARALDFILRFSRLGRARTLFGSAFGLMKTFGRGPKAAPAASAAGKAPFDALPYCVRRIRLAFELPGVRRLKCRRPGIWRTEAETFTDAYRFMLLICDIGRIECVKRAGCVRYAAPLQDGEGRIVLSERAGNEENTLAVMTFEIEKLPDVKELRFRCAAKRSRWGHSGSSALPADEPPRRRSRRPIVWAG